MHNEQQNKGSGFKNSLLKLVTINLFVLACFLLVILAVIEGYLRGTIPGSSNESIFSYSLDTKRYKLMKKDHRIMAWGKELRTNELGFRDNKTVLLKKQPNEYRVIVLGDSFTVSAGVEFDSTYTALLEKTLNQHDNNIKVMSLAVGGYNIVQYEMVLNEVALSLQPDLLLVSVFPSNDFSMETYDRNYLVAKGQYKEPEIPWFKETYVYRAFLWRIDEKFEAFFKPQKELVENNFRQDAVRGWNENSAALGRIIKISHEKNIAIVVALLPHTWGFESQFELTDRIKAFLVDYDTEPVILLYPFIESGVEEPDLRVNLLDSHPNNQYHDLVAKHLAPYLAQIISEGEKYK